jgi:hypothetical protein
MAGPNEERAQLRSLAARHGWRLRPGSREGLSIAATTPGYSPRI